MVQVFVLYRQQVGPPTTSHRPPSCVNPRRQCRLLMFKHFTNIHLLIVSTCHTVTIKSVAIDFVCLTFSESNISPSWRHRRPVTR